MGIVASQNVSLTQEYYNDITQVSQQYCVANTDVVSGPSVVIVNGSTIDGDFTGVQTEVSTDSSCMMVSYMENNIDSILEATANQTDTDETDIFSAFSTTLFSRDKATVDQVLSTNIYQINQAVCQASTTLSTAGSYVYVTDTDVGGDFLGVSTSSDTSANCVMANMAKNVTKLQASATDTQSSLDEGMFATFFNSIASVIAVIVIVVIIVVVLVVGLKIFKKKPTPAPVPAPGTGVGTLTIPLE